MARSFTVFGRITAKDEASATLGRVESRFTRFSNFLRRNFVAALAVSSAAVFGFVRALRSVISASQEQEDAVNALRAATIKFGDASDDVADRLAKQAAALQQVTRFGDEQIIRGQALLATFTDEESKIREATQAALDFAAATGRDLDTAFLLFGKALAGQTAELSRYGILLDEGIPQNEKFAAVMKKVREQFGGRAGEDVKTFSGRVAQLQNAFGDLLEQLGDTITQSEGLGESISNLTRFIQDNGATIARVVTAEFKVLSAILSGIAAKFSQLGTAIGKLINVYESLSGRLETVEVNQSALEATAARLGITVAELRERLAATGGAIGSVSTAAAKAKEEVEEFATATKKAGDATSEATDALTELGKALGVVTSAELSEEIAKIETNLAKAREELGANSREYVRLEEIASARIESLQDRIQNLRDGLGDLTTDTQVSVDTFDAFATSVGVASEGVDRLTQSTQRNTQAARDNAAAIAANPTLGSALQAGRTTPFVFAGGTFTFIGGRRALVLPDGRIEYPNS